MMLILVACLVLVRMTVENDVLPSGNVDRSKIEHLTPEQQCELLALIDGICCTFQ